MKYLILGADGQIGSSLSHYLSFTEHDVLQWDIRYGPWHDLRRAEFLPDLRRQMREVDMVIFLAFDVGGSTYLKQYQDTYEFIDNNTRLMTNTFSALEAAKVPFIFASSQMSQMNWSTYGRLKAVGEAYTAALGGLTVKFWNVYDYEPDVKKYHVISDFIVGAMNGKIEMKTDGTESRQLLHGRDAARALRILSEQYGNLNRESEYHITSFGWHTIREVADTVADVVGAHSGSRPVVVPGEATDSVQGVRFEPDSHILNYWTPTTPLFHGINDVYARMLGERNG